MASYTEADVTAMEAAIAKGALTVRNANGEMVTYRSLEEMMRILDTMRATTAPLTRPIRSAYVRFVND